jgi:putative tricarboxylic transport membrane protein
MWGPTERTGDLITSGVLFCIGLFSIINSQMMPPAGYGEVGPGFFPKIIGTLLCGISLSLVIQSFIKGSTTNGVGMSHRKVWYIVAAIIFLAILFEKIGFIPLVALFVGFLLKIFSNMGYKKCIAFGVAAAISAYLIFGSLLELQLPRGELVMNLLRWGRLY